MTRVSTLYLSALVTAAALGFGLPFVAPEQPVAAVAQTKMVPQYRVDPFWPKPLPNNWIIGEVSGIAVDSRDHIWIIHRPGTLLPGDELGAASDPPRNECCKAAPPVIEFDAEGNVIQAWGGKGEGYDWPNSEHGIFVDYKDNVWIAGNSAGFIEGRPETRERKAPSGQTVQVTNPQDAQVLKFTRSGKFLLQIGRPGKVEGSGSATTLNRPADMEVDPKTNQVYVADGYGNHRIVVFDADTGEHKRHWGAYGKPPTDENLGRYDPDAPVAQQFRTPVHCAVISNDDLVYVCDRVNNRLQIFKKDGTFVREVFIAKRTLGPNGAVWDVGLSPDKPQQYLYVPDGDNGKVWMLLRAEMAILGSFGRKGRYAGQFTWLHNLAVDSKGNIYTAEVQNGRRTQKFVYLGAKPASANE